MIDKPCPCCGTVQPALATRTMCLPRLTLSSEPTQVCPSQRATNIALSADVDVTPGSLAEFWCAGRRCRSV
jgi:hypothetical protein